MVDGRLTQKMMKKIMVIMLCLLLVLPMALAQEETPEETNETEITPDSPLYVLDDVIDRLALSMKFGQAAKIEKSLEIARERLKEAEDMVEQGNFNKAEKAREKYEKIIDKLVSYVERIESNGSAEKAEKAMKKVSDI